MDGPHLDLIIQLEFDMPQYVVVLRINVPTLGERMVTTPALAAVDIPDAIRQAMATVIVEPTEVTKAGP